MIKILLNGNEIVEFKGHMDLRIGQEIKILGCKYYIKSVESTRVCVKVEVEKEQKRSIKINGSPFGMGTINGGYTSAKLRYNTNPFDR